MHDVGRRFDHLRALFHRGVWWLFLGLWSAFGILATVRDNFLSAEVRTKWDTFYLIPHWSVSTWTLVLLTILIVGLFEGSYRLQADISRDLTQYRANDPRVDVTKVTVHEYVPYQISVEANIENPGEPTVLRSWSVRVVRGNGEVVKGHLLGDDSWACRSYEPGKDGSSAVVDHSTFPLRSGGTAKAAFRFDFMDPIVSLGLDDQTSFEVSCRTIKNQIVGGRLRGAPSAAEQPWPMDDNRMIDRHLRLPEDPSRTHVARLPVARALFDELVVSSSGGNKESQKSVFHIGHYLVLISLACHGMTPEYVKDFDHFREGCVRAGIRSRGYSGDG